MHYSPHRSLNMFFKKASIVHFQGIASSCFTAEADKRPCCFWTEANKSILANQRAVFRSGAKATFTLKRHASWEEFRQSWLKVFEDGSFRRTWWTCDIFFRAKRKIKSETFSWSLANGEGKAPCFACNHIPTVYDHNKNNVCQASTLSFEEITKIKQVFSLTLKHEMWSYLLLPKNTFWCYLLLLWNT